MSREEPYDHEEKIEDFAAKHFASECWCLTVQQAKDEVLQCGRCQFKAFCEELVDHWRGEDYEELFAQLSEAEAANRHLNRVNHELTTRVQDTRSERAREGVRAAAQVPLLWGRGDYSLGFSIHQHILALIDEHDPLWGFHVLSKEKIEKLIEEKGYVSPMDRFSPRPTIMNFLRTLFGKYPKREPRTTNSA